MQIKCPRCQARASLPDSKEGAKVKCGECGRVYVARMPGSKQTSNTGMMIGVGVVLVGVLGLMIVASQDGEETAAAPKKKAPVAEPKAFVDELSWEGPVARAAAALHEAVYQRDLPRVRRSLDASHAWAHAALRAPEAEAAETPAEDDEYTAFDLPDDSGFFALPSLEQSTYAGQLAEDLVNGEGRALVGDWHPYDGEVIELTDEAALVRLAVTPRDPADGVEKRYVEWRLSKEGAGTWKAYAWERWIDPAEAARMRKRDRGYEKVTLSDGSKVLEREPEPLPHLADTPPELAAEIDSLYATMIDLDLTTESNDARQRIVEIGRPAIPRLLTGLYETPLDTEENGIRANIVVQALRDITGQFFGYKPQTLVGSGTGTTEERRLSAIRQWFAWWYRYESRFTGNEEAEDGLEGLIELTEKEKAWLERNKD